MGAKSRCFCSRVLPKLTIDDDIAALVACGRMEILANEKVVSPVSPADKARMLQVFAARDAEEVAKSKEVKAVSSLIR